MRKFLYVFLVCFVGLYACVDDNLSLGKSLVDSSFYNVYADTCTVDISTVLLDSIETRGDSVCQFGHYKDTLWGEVFATYYAEYTKASFTPNADHAYSLDSLVLRLIPSGHFWGDTLASQRISVYRLKYPIVLDDDSDLYNTTRLQLSDSPLFTFTYTPYPGGRKKWKSDCLMRWGKRYWTILWRKLIILTRRMVLRKNSPGWPWLQSRMAVVLQGSW